MRNPNPRVRGIVLLMVGLALGLFLAVMQSARETALSEFAIAAIIVIAAACVAFGGFMIARNRNPRVDSGIR
jgi:hypothetical protein